MKSISNLDNDWDVDQSRLNRLKEEYKRDRHVKHSTTGSTSIRTNLLDNGNDETSNDQRTFNDDDQSMNFSDCFLLKN